MGHLNNTRETHRHTKGDEEEGSLSFFRVKKLSLAKRAKTLLCVVAENNLFRVVVVVVVYVVGFFGTRRSEKVDVFVERIRRRRRRRRLRRSLFLRRVTSILEEKGNPYASDASNNKERNERDTLPREVRQTSRATPPPPPRVQPFYAALRGCQNLWNRFHVEQQIVSQKRRRPLRKTEKCRCFR